jgi:hypothetical protein
MPPKSKNTTHFFFQGYSSVVVNGKTQRLEELQLEKSGSKPITGSYRKEVDGKSYGKKKISGEKDLKAILVGKKSKKEK